MRGGTIFTIAPNRPTTPPLLRRIPRLVITAPPVVLLYTPAITCILNDYKLGWACGGGVFTCWRPLCRLPFLCLCYHCSTGGIISQWVGGKKWREMVFYRGGDVVIFTFFVRFLFTIRSVFVRFFMGFYSFFFFFVGGVV